MSSTELIKHQMNDGWVKARQNGSHVTLTKSGGEKIITVPHPRKNASKGIIRQAQVISGLKLL
ncbi:type II toxin-antitoxin system HicA family toxin [Xenorhabdus hominickii]|uniref:Addiction module toxin, HicA family n=1 Tax=Xenorhabdus hominickii TaxID=351679 RepID=A0A1V0M4N2_XENHO|nr:type II toxin-antitoxin system HicA family toxin [Xenorhabdus hominickii]ARD69827.1 YcfA-like protein [Xenorhabdus hominickii]PHM51897.1 addiction module toxin, HicA family [Xenorhabdus hominickii]